MASTRRSVDWGFPRWRGYGSKQEATQVRRCDHFGCDAPGNCPAPKAPNSRERWHFCTEHAAEYNRNWNYFAGLSEEEAARRAEAERRSTSGFAEASHYGWAGPGDGSRSRDEMRALAALELDDSADFTTIHTAWRRLAKQYHPDVCPGNADAARRFQEIQAAYAVLRVTEERRKAS